MVDNSALVALYIDAICAQYCIGEDEKQCCVAGQTLEAFSLRGSRFGNSPKLFSGQKPQAYK